MRSWSGAQRTDEGGFLYLTDRKANIIIISGGVNINPQEAENVLTVHAKVHDGGAWAPWLRARSSNAL